MKSIDAYLERSGGSRGSYLVLDKDGEAIPGLGEAWRFRPEDTGLRRYVLEYYFRDGVHETTWLPVRDIPGDEFWFETVWREFSEGKVFF